MPKFVPTRFLASAVVLAVTLASLTAMAASRPTGFSIVDSGEFVPTQVLGELQAIPLPTPKYDYTPNALHIVIGEKGRKYVRNHLDDLLRRNGYDFSEAEFPVAQYKAPQPMNLDALPEALEQKIGPLLREVRTALKKYFFGFALKNPEFTILAENIAFSMKPSRFGTDFKGLVPAGLGFSSGILLNLELVVPDIKLNADAVKATDLANPFFGTFGLNKFRMKLKFPGQPQSTANSLRFTLPIAMGVTDQGQLRARVLNVASNPQYRFQTNLDTVPLIAGFNTPMILPQFSITGANGTTIRTDSAAMEAEIAAKWPELLKALQVYLTNYMKEELPGSINKVLDTFVASTGLEDTNTILPPAGPFEIEEKDKYIWGLRGDKVGVNGQSLSFQFGGFISDPWYPGFQVDMSSWTASTPTFSDYPSDDFDVAVAVHQQLINTALQLDCNRKYLDKIVTDDPRHPMTILKCPTIDTAAAPSRDLIPLKVRIAQDVSGFMETIAVDNPVKLDLTLYATMSRNANGRPNLIIKYIDEREDHIILDRDSVRFGFLYGTVKGKVVKRVKKTNLEYTANPKVLAKDFSIFNQVAGVKTDIKAIKSDPNGFAVLYLDFKGVPR